MMQLPVRPRRDAPARICISSSNTFLAHMHEMHHAEATFWQTHLFTALSILALGVRGAPAYESNASKSDNLTPVTRVRVGGQRLLLPVERHQMLYTTIQSTATALSSAGTGIFRRLRSPQIEIGTERSRTQMCASAVGLQADRVVVDG